MLLNRGCANDELFLSRLQSFSGYFNLYYEPVPCSESSHHCILGKSRAITLAFGQSSGSDIPQGTSERQGLEGSSKCELLRDGTAHLLNAHPWLPLYLLGL